MLKTDPAVFAVGENYQIMVPVEDHSLFWVKVGNNFYYDDSNGILRSSRLIHRVTVPMKELDCAKQYTVFEEPIVERLPSFTKTASVIEKTYSFRPVPSDRNVRFYHIADAHNDFVDPVVASETFGEIDFLILNGDIPDHSGKVENFDFIYKIASALTHGNIPTVFSRGNHDLRGVCAESIADYTPIDNGNSYFTFRLGNIWGVVLDCGEDKPDSHPEYGHTICCHDFRLRETEFLKQVIRNADSEYNAPGVTHRFVISHVPFIHRLIPPFDIEEEIYSEWARLLREEVKPDLMICGHLHTYGIYDPGSDFDDYGQPCTTVVGSYVEDYHFIAGVGFCIKDKTIDVTFTDNKKNVILKKSINC